MNIKKVDSKRYVLLFQINTKFALLRIHFDLNLILKSPEIGISYLGLSAQLYLFIVPRHFSQWFMEVESDVTWLDSILLFNRWNRTLECACVVQF